MYFQRLREDSDLSQAQVAAILGIQQTVYSRYERGAHDTFPICPIDSLQSIRYNHGASEDSIPVGWRLVSRTLADRMLDEDVE